METSQHKTVNRTTTVQPAAALKIGQRQAITAAKAVRAQNFGKVSSPQDPAEMEAEATAKKVMRMAVPESSVAYVGTDRGGMFRQVKQKEKEKKPRLRLESPYLRRFGAAGIFSKEKNKDEKIQRTAEERPKEKEKIQRKQAGQPEVSFAVAADIEANLGTGAPLPLSVRRIMEPRFKADFSQVRIHTDQKAASLSKKVSAQAFTVGNQIFFGEDRFKPDSLEGQELIAHELTHTIQQGAAVQRRAEVSVTQQAPPMVQRLGISDILDYLAEKAYNIPGYRMFTIVIGVNPINMERVDRSAANILRAMVEFMPLGHQITQALDKYGVFEEAGAWVNKQIDTLGMVGSAFYDALMTFLDSLGWRDFLHPIRTVERAIKIFTDPVDKLIAFAKEIVIGILSLIKKAILRPLASLAKDRFPGWYDLLKAVMGEDPVTNEKVEVTPDLIIGSFMKLIGQEEVWLNLKKANAVAKAWAWFKKALSSLVNLVRQIPARFIDALQSLTIGDIIVLPRAFVKLASVFGNFVADFLKWGLDSVLSLLEIIFEVVAPRAIPYLRKTGKAFSTIIKRPIVFVGHLVQAGKLGFQQFSSKFGTYLKESLLQWLTGALGPTVYIPKSFEIREIIKFVLSVLGLTWQNIREKLVKVVGETAVKAMETGFDIVATLVTEGPAAAWEKIKEQLANLQDMVMGEITKYVTVTVVQNAIAKLLTMLTPAGAFIQAIIAIYNTIMFFVERLSQIIKVVTAFLDSLAAIAAGVIVAAAKRVEATLAGLLTTVISFLARFAGLGKVSEAVTGIITKIRTPIDQALDKVVEWIVSMAKKGGKFLVASAKGIFTWAFAKSSFADEDGQSHTIAVEPSGDTAILMIASTPMAAEEFLAFYEAKRGKKEANFAENNKKTIGQIKAAIKMAKPLVEQIDTLQKANPQDPKLDGLQRDLLNINKELTEKLSKLVGKDPSIAKAREKYLLEGLTGTYSSLPKPRGDEFTADHQPQAAILVAAAEFDYFSDTGGLAKRAAGRAKEGYAINLHKIRHEAGRTYGSKGKKTKNDFLDEIAKWTKGKKSFAEKRKIVVDQIKIEMKDDVKAMTTVAEDKTNPKNWVDIMKLKGEDEDKKSLVEDISVRIVAGERQIAAQDIDSLIF